MSRLLDPLRRKLVEAVQAAAVDMQAVMDFQLEYAMLSYPWEWNGVHQEESRMGYPYSNSGGNGRNGDLMKSKEMSPIIELREGGGLQVVFGWKWDPVFEESGRHYAALVHDGSEEIVEYQMYYRTGGFPVYSGYSARPWTAWVVPRDQRSKMSISSSAVQPEDVPDIGWKFAKKAFVDALKSRLHGSTIRISL